MIEINGIGAIATRGLCHISTANKNALELHYVDSPNVVRLSFGSPSAYYRAYNRLKGEMFREEVSRG